MANRRISRTKNFASYVNAINQDVSTLKNLDAGGSISARSITGDALADTVTLFGNAIQSNNYAPGATGWKIDGSGVAEFADVYVRGDINAETGTIGYWNISPVDATRYIGPKKIFGTFLESTDVGINDNDKEDGVYVSLFKSYFEDTLPIINARRVSNVATITVPGHTYEPGDYVQVIVNEDSTFNAFPVAVQILETTVDTFSYSNTGSDFPVADAVTGIIPSTTVSGTAQYYQKDVAGLFVRDYAKVDFDYGYFSSDGIKFSSGETVNIIYNPSFYSETSWDFTSAATVFQTTSGFSQVNYLPIAGYSGEGFESQWYNEAALDGTTDYIEGIVDYPSGKKYKLFDEYDRPLYLSADVGVTLPHTVNNVYGVTANATTIVLDTTYPHYLEVGDIVYLDFTLEDGVTYKPGNQDYIDFATAKSGDRMFSIAAVPTGSTFTVTNHWGVSPDADGLSLGSLDVDAPKTPSVVGVSKGRLVTSASINMSTTDCVFTANGHNFVVGEYVYLDFQLLDSESYDIAVNWGMYDGGSQEPRTWEITAVAANTFTVTGMYTTSGVNETIVPSALTSDNGFTRLVAAYRAQYTRYDFNDTKFVFSNGSTTSLSSVLTSASAATFSSGSNTRYVNFFANDYLYDLLAFTSAGSKLKTAKYEISSYKLEQAYKTLDPDGWAAESQIKLRLPAALKMSLPLGAYVGPTEPTNNFVYWNRLFIDNVGLHTGSEFFYGADGSGSSRWADVLNPYATYSISSPAAWIDVDVESNKSTLSHASSIDFLPTTSKILTADASISSSYPPSWSTDYANMFNPYGSYGRSKVQNDYQGSYLVDENIVTMSAGEIFNKGLTYANPLYQSSYVSSITSSFAAGSEMGAVRSIGIYDTSKAVIGAWVDASGKSYASIVSDTVHFRNKNGEPTLSGGYTIKTTGAVPFTYNESAFEEQQLPQNASHGFRISTGTDATTTSSSGSYTGTVLGGYFRTGASGKVLVIAGGRYESNNSAGVSLGGFNIRAGSTYDANGNEILAAAGAGTVIVGFSSNLAVPVEGTFQGGGEVSYLFFGTPYTTYWTGHVLATNGTGTTTAYSRWLTVIPVG